MFSKYGSEDTKHIDERSQPSFMVAWSFVELDDVGSTQTIAKGLAAKGAPEGTTVVAKSQSSGEGRLGRSWVSPTGGLYMSFVLRPEGISKPELIALVTAVAVVDGIKQDTGLDTAIRWPNDIMAGGKKLAGVIAEAQSYKQKITQVVVGVGVNCNAPVSNAELGKEATSLAEELGKQFEISELKHSILDSFSQLYERWRAGENMMPLWKEYVATVAKPVSIKLKTNETAFSYQAVSIDSEGSLLVTKDGKQTIVRAEDLEWLREQA
ncbi:MAG: biotin--[acetyl-CoA-carboxylase] ligase [Thaumarchaeota archaeon]|nr:biotin--[acetyl-CoA-carboxylase] ligase [Nitrososphaerota archaeon]